MSQVEKLKQICNETHECCYEKHVEYDVFKVLTNIAESLAIIADSLKKEKK